MNINKRIGETRIMNCGLKATIIEYKRYDNIDVEFENGFINKHKSYKSFLKGEIGCHHRRKNYDDIIGENKVMNCGLRATIIKCRTLDDIDVKFENGFINKHKTYRNFKTGSIGCGVNGAKSYYESYSVLRVGEIKTMNCGLKAEIVKYRASGDIDVKFEDGLIIEHRSYDHFQRGVISHPDINVSNKRCEEKCVGESRIMNNGLQATIVAYRNYKDIDIRFEDGTEVLHKVYSAFKEKAIKHPLINIPKTQKSTALWTVGTFNAYRFKNDLFSATCARCGYHNFLSIRQMLAHYKTHAKGNVNK